MQKMTLKCYAGTLPFFFIPLAAQVYERARVLCENYATRAHTTTPCTAFV